MANPNTMIQAEIFGIQCDATACDYRDDNVKREEYPDYLNKPCPKCGESLLTPEDYRMMQVIENAAKMVEQMSPEMLEKVSQEMNAFLSPEQLEQLKQIEESGATNAHVRFELNGTGDVKTTFGPAPETGTGVIK